MRCSGLRVLMGFVATAALSSCVPYSSWWKHPQTGEVLKCDTHSVMARERAVELSMCENTMRSQGFQEIDEP